MHQESPVHGSESGGERPPRKAPANASAPELAALMAEECRRLLMRLDQRLQDPELRALAVDNLIGYTNQEIAWRRGCSVRTVERQLKLIRQTLREGPTL